MTLTDLVAELRPEHWAIIIGAISGAFATVTAAALAMLGAWLKARADKQVALANVKLASANVAAQQQVTKQQIDAQIDQRLAGEVERLSGELEELRQEMTTLTSKFSQWKAAVARVFHAIAAQWTGDGGPDIDPADIALLEDTIPLRWMRRRARTSTAPISTVPTEGAPS